MEFAVTPLWIDIAIIVFIAIYIVGKLNKGFIQGVVDLIGFIFSLVFALKFYSFAAGILSTKFNLTHGVSNALGFFIMAFVGEIVLFLLSAIIFKYIHSQILESKINKRLSFIPAIASAVILIAFFLTALLVLPVRPHIKQAVSNSYLGNVLTSRTMGLERSINNIFGGAIQEALAFMTVKPESDETIDLNFQTTEFSTDRTSEQEMIALLNSERKKNNLGIVTENSELRSVARAHCEDMFTRGYFSHYTPEGYSPFDRMDTANISYLAAGENLAYAPNVEIAHKGLMDSPGHRANILSDKYAQVGVGVIDAGIYGKMFCQVFSN